MEASNGRRFLHLTSAEPDNLRAALQLLGRDEKTIGFRDTLAEGPLHDLDAGAAARVEWWTRLEGTRLGVRYARDLDDSPVWNRIRSDRRDFVIWHGPSAAERLFALRACWQLRQTPRRIHQVRLPFQRLKYLPSFYGAVGVLAPDELADAWRSLGRVRDVGARARKWVAIRARRGDWVRELRGDRIVAFPPDVYDELVLRACGNGWVSSPKVVGRVIAKAPCGDIFFGWRLRELIAQGVLEGRGGSTRLGWPKEFERSTALTPCSDTRRTNTLSSSRVLRGAANVVFPIPAAGALPRS